MTAPLKILMLENNATDAETVQQLLKKKKPHCEFSLAMNKEAYLLALDEFKPDVIIADNSLPQFSAAEALEISRRRTAYTPFIMVADTLTEESTEIINSGADDYVIKDRLTRLPVAIEAALKQQTTEKEKLEAIEKLNLNEENYRKLVERISDGFMALDLNWRFTYVNKKAEQLFKRPHSYLIGKNIWSEFPETVYRSFYKAYHKAMESQENGSLQDYSILLGKWVEANFYPSLSGISIFFRDISEQKKAEEKLKDSEEKYRTLFDQAIDGIFIADSNGNLLDANSALCTMFGCPKENMLNANLQDGFFEEDLKTNPIGYDILKQGLPVISERRIKRTDGSAAYVETSSRMLPNGQIQGIVRDISERKKKEIELKESEEKYRTLIDRTSDGVMIYSLDGTILDLNNNSSSYLGYTKEELNKINIKDLFFEEDLQKRPLSFERLKEGFSVIDYRRLKRKDGSPVEMEISTIMLPDGNLMAFGRNTTDRKRLEKEQRRNLEELTAVYNLSYSLSRANSLEEIFAEAMNTLRDTIHADRSSILLFDTDGVMRFKAWQDLSDEYREAVDGHSPWSKETKNAEPIFVTNADEDASVEQWRTHFRREGISALAFIPIMQNGNLLGKFMLYSNTPRFFSNRESRLAQNIASHVAFAIERQKAEEELRLKENAISKSISGMGMTDLAGKIIYANEALGKMWGCTNKEELIGKMLTDVFEGPRVHQTIEALKTKGFENGEDTGRKIDGSLFTVAFSANVIQDEKGNPVCMFGSFIDITEQKRAEEEIIKERQRAEKERLANKTRQQREITRAILQTQETERMALGRELHDNINQILSAINMKLEFCIHNYDTSKKIVEDCHYNLQEAIIEIRNLSHRMVIPVFSKEKLTHVLRSLVTFYSTIQLIELDVDQMKEADMPADIKATLFRIAQEQLNNVQKHARASKVLIKLIGGTDYITMLIKDNGVGFDTRQKRKGIGITNILNRVKAYNGSVDLISEKGKGCSLSVSIPLTGQE